MIRRGKPEYLGSNRFNLGIMIDGSIRRKRQKAGLAQAGSPRAFGGTAAGN
jgi:hypothetical protein